MKPTKKQINKIKEIEKHKILIILPRKDFNKEVNYCYHFPLGIAYVSSILKNKGFNVDCLNLNHEKGSLKEILDRFLDKKKYDYVCSGGTCLNYQVIKEVIRLIRKHKSKPKIILGGIIVVTESELIFDLIKPDYAIVGEAEIPILELLEGKDRKRIKGLMFKKGNKLIYNGLSEVVLDLDKVPTPDFQGFGYYKDLENQHSNTSLENSVLDYPRVYPILGSRGCPFSCTFCFHYSKYRKRSIKNIMEELREAVKKYKINIIKFYDECIALDKERLIKICKEIKSLSKEVGWKIYWMPQLTVHNIDRKILKIMKDSGVCLISYGFESFSKKILKSMGKPITPKMIKNAFNLTLESKIGVQANFIFGDPKETSETAKQTLDWWKKYSNGQINLSFIIPYLGSQDYKYCIDKKIIKDKKKYVEEDMGTFSKINMTSMSTKEFYKLQRDLLYAVKKYCKFVIPKKRKVNNKYNLIIKCPYCHETNIYKNINLKTKFMNKWNFGFRLICRSCFYTFYCVSLLKKIAYKLYPFLRKYRDKQLKRIVVNFK